MIGQWTNPSNQVDSTFIAAPPPPSSLLISSPLVHPSDSTGILEQNHLVSQKIVPMSFPSSDNFPVASNTETSSLDLQILHPLSVYDLTTQISNNISNTSKNIADTPLSTFALNEANSLYPHPTNLCGDNQIPMTYIQNIANLNQEPIPMTLSEDLTTDLSAFTGGFQPILHPGVENQMLIGGPLLHPPLPPPPPLVTPAELFATADEIDDQKKLHIRGKPIKDKTCRICLKKFSRQRNLKIHIGRIHLMHKAFQCGYCDRAFAINYDKDRHMDLHTGDPPYLCNFCFAQFKSKVYFANHMNLHQMGKLAPCPSFQCPISSCKYNFISREAYQNHMDEHGGYIRCLECISDNVFRKDEYFPHRAQKHPTLCKPNSTNNNSLLKSHRVDCPHCEYQFRGFDVLQKHILRAHSDNIESRKTIFCGYCDSKFTTTRARNLHHRIHTGEKPFSCDVCGKRFTYKMSLRIHKETHVGRKRIACRFDDCRRYYLTQKALNSHVLSYHLNSGANPEHSNVENEELSVDEDEAELLERSENDDDNNDEPTDQSSQINPEKTSSNVEALLEPSTSFRGNRVKLLTKKTICTQTSLKNNDILTMTKYLEIKKSMKTVGTQTDISNDTSQDRILEL